MDDGKSEPVDHHPGAESIGENKDVLLAFFNRVFDNSQDMINLFSLTRGSVVIHNRAACDSTGYTPEDYMNIPVEKFYPPKELAKLNQAFQDLATSGFVTVNVKMYVKSGDLKDYSIRAYVIQREPEVICLVHTIDVTEERRREDRAIREAKLATLGESSAVLTHELSNALQSMQFNLHCIETDKDNVLSPFTRQRLEKAKKSSAHMENVIRNVRRYVSTPGASNSFISLTAITHDALQLMKGYFDTKKIELTVDLDAGLPPVRANATQVQQILLIFFKNAVQAMEAKAPRRLEVRAKEYDGEVRLTIADSGCGIPSNLEPRLFQAFATSKISGGGVGLGLAIAKRLAQSNSIDINFVTEVDKGTTFSLHFPADVGAAAALAGNQSVLWGKNVLIVEDNPDALQSMAEMLGAHGVRVLTAVSASEGLRILTLHAVHATVCALKMYPVGGVQFARDARSVYQGPICFMVDEWGASSEGELAELNPYWTLVKPFAVETMVDMVASMIPSGVGSTPSTTT